VLSNFDSETLKPVGTVGPHDSIKDVLPDSTLLDRTGQNSRWTLIPEVRQDVLRQMGSKQILRKALRANPNRPENSTQRMLDAYILEEAPALDSQNPDQVAGTFQVAPWLGGILDGIPDQDSIRQRYEQLSLLQPFDVLAGAHFRGRHEELQKLRAYVGVLPPGSVRERLNRITAAIFSLAEKPPLVIQGAGGVGKSALVARFIFEHATLPHTEQFPWAYIDFDRPGILAEEPLTLLVEAVRQLGIQYPYAREHSDRIRRDWQEFLTDPTRQASPAAARARHSKSTPVIVTRSGPQEWDRFLRDFALLLGNLKVEEDPFLLVLDTFEEVQYRSDVVVANLAAFLKSFQQQVPRLRSVLAGRAPVTGIAGFPTQEVSLKDFDPEAAQGFLEANGVRPPDVAKTLAHQVGGNPLSLNLAVALWKSSEMDQRDLGLPAHRLFGFRLRENEIQGQLYARILEHINDEDARKLAHPGLVLRRVTPELISEVLAKPCGLTIKDANEARRLFDELKREVALVTLEEDDALRHRPDVRRIMLGLLREDEPEKVRQIEEAAIAYYEKQDGVVNRAEEIYHRLSLMQPLPAIEKRWIEGVQPYLFSALDELNVCERAWLASRLGRTLTTAERAQANLEAWERDTAHRVRELLEHGRMDGALAALRERIDRMPGSPLYQLEAQVLELKEDWPEAQRVIEEGIASASRGGNRGLAIALRLRGAKVDIRLDELEAARQKLDEAAALLTSRGEDLVRSLEITLIRLTLRRTIDDDADAIRSLQVQLRDSLGRLTDGQIVEQTILIGWLASELRSKYPQVLHRIVRLGGLETDRPALLRALGRALAAWDEQVSREADDRPGVMGRKVGLRGRGTLIEVWTSFTLETRPSTLKRTMNELLDSFQPVPNRVWDVIADVLWDRAKKVSAPESPLGALPSRPGSARLQPFDAPYPESNVEYASDQTSLSRREVRQLGEALKEAFPTRYSLAQMVRFRLDRNLEVISLSDDLDTSVFELVEVARAGGWIVQLLAAAREARPESARLLAFSEQHGLEPARILDQDLERVLKQANSLLDPSRWRTRFGRLQTQVCRIEFEQSDSSPPGAGFLVGPNLLLTTYRVIEPIHQGTVDPWDVLVRFDYKRMENGVEVNPGTLYRLDTDWLAGYSVYSAGNDANESSLADRLDFALMRLAGSPGAEPIGGDRAEPDSAPRGWMDIRSDTIAPHPGMALTILYYGLDETLQLSLDTTGIVRLYPGGTRLSYANEMSGALLGSPCFTMNWDPIAIHQRNLDSGGEGVPLDAVLRQLEMSGSRDLLGGNKGGYSDYSA
jgi:hypothetical protein